MVMMMDSVLDSQQYLLVNNQFALADDQPQAVFSPVNKMFNARTTADAGGLATTTFATWLEYLRAVSLQVFAISILLAVTHFAHAQIPLVLLPIPAFFPMLHIFPTLYIWPISPKPSGCNWHL